jgi:glycosyltransferase involved in cell wall biosynthesis
MQKVVKTPLKDPNRPVVHWVSPVPPAATDIAHYTARILPALATQAHVVLWTDTPDWDDSLEAYAVVQHFDADYLLPADLQRAARLAGAPEGATQSVFIHIGNSWVFHGNLLRLARRLPATVVLHDLAIQEMMNDAITHDMFDVQSYLDEMMQWYGVSGHAAALECRADGVRAQAIAPLMPGFELALPNALSILAHTSVACDAARAHDTVPVHQLELPFQPGPEPLNRRARFGPLRLLQFGYIGPNRRLLEVLEALNVLKDTVDFKFDVMGNLWNPGLISDKIAKLGLEDRVILHGFVHETDLDSALRQAHLVFNLRHPTLGEASGSQLRIWNAGAAAVVRDSGWYSHLPKDTVFHIPDDDDAEQNAIQNLIYRIAQDRHIIRSIHTAGRARLISHHHPDDYAREIVKIARNTGAEAAARYFPKVGTAKQ